MHIENYKTSLRKIKEDLNNEQTFQVPGLEESVFFRWKFSPKLITYSTQSLSTSKLPFLHNDKVILECIWNAKDQEWPKQFWGEKKVKSITLPDFQSE